MVIEAPIVVVEPSRNLAREGLDLSSGIGYACPYCRAPLPVSPVLPIDED
jgi:hypothetical protein